MRPGTEFVFDYNKSNVFTKSNRTISQMFWNSDSSYNPARILLAQNQQQKHLRTLE